MKLSIIIPVYNEEKTVIPLVEKVVKLNLPAIAKEIIIVDDGSTDTTPSQLKIIKSKKQQIKIIKHGKNQGKGAAIRTALKQAGGDYIIIQDADLEYNPQEIIKLLIPLKDKNIHVIYGTRLKRPPNLKKDEKDMRFLLHYVGNKFLSFITSLLYWQWITDMETCYKLFSKKSINCLHLTAKGFEFEPEITAKLLKAGYKIVEVPISTNPRGYNEGKKLNTFKDGVRAFWTLVKYRFVD